MQGVIAGDRKQLLLFDYFLDGKEYLVRVGIDCMDL